MKTINDKFGHLHGDLAVKTIASVISSVIPKNWLAIRYGGDEFMLIVPTEMPAYVVRVIRECLREEIASCEDRLHYTLQVSIGYADWDGRRANFRKSVINADHMMYEDKRVN